MGGLQAWLNLGIDTLSSSHQTLIFPTCFIFMLFCLDLGLICCLGASSAIQQDTVAVGSGEGPWAPRWLLVTTIPAHDLR